ncbi:exopolysaccharide biosynthesis protein [Candidatus Peregrinibacteria bacterium]|nr:exopolysaccharide biosynthesis protein [bacterium]NCQ55785.1 exopolysaccharide biosynthesis protein [Candidatus Parcubacteria bacterium]NCS67852.1 exopolysaccharide biosynthesis protein [Candidatus Peregrinibacteria bacterium]
MLSDTINDLLSESKSLSAQQILKKTGTSSFGLLLALLALPSALPVPAPGYSIPFGILIVFLGSQLLFNFKQPWLPTKVAQKQITLKNLEGLKVKIVSFLKFFEKFIHPRWLWVSRLPQPFWGLLITACGICLLLPIPLTNTIPAFAVFLIGLGTLEKDGVFKLLGLGAAIVGLSLTATILFIGLEGLKFLLSTISA